MSGGGGSSHIVYTTLANTQGVRSGDGKVYISLVTLPATTCAAGQYLASTTLTCTTCAAGSYAISTGSLFCTPCPLGTYSTSGTGSTSNTCTSYCTTNGLTTNAIGSSSSDDCLAHTQSPPGKYSTNTAGTLDCAAGNIFMSIGSFLTYFSAFLLFLLF